MGSRSNSFLDTDLSSSWTKTLNHISVFLLVGGKKQKMYRTSAEREKARATPFVLHNELSQYYSLSDDWTLAPAPAGRKRQWSLEELIYHRAAAYSRAECYWGGGDGPPRCYSRTTWGFTVTVTISVWEGVRLVDWRCVCTRPGQKSVCAKRVHTASKIPHERINTVS